MFELAAVYNLLTIIIFIISQAITNETFILQYFFFFRFIVTALLIISVAYAPQNGNNPLWNAAHKLTVNDFEIQTNAVSLSFTQVSIYHQLTGFNFWKKNSSKTVRNCIIKSASRIDTPTDINQSLIDQQTLFAIAEIYTRQFRKGLRDNRKKLLKGYKFADELNNQIMTAFSIT